MRRPSPHGTRVSRRGRSRRASTARGGEDCAPRGTVTKLYSRHAGRGAPGSGGRLRGLFRMEFPLLARDMHVCGRRPSGSVPSSRGSRSCSRLNCTTARPAATRRRASPPPPKSRLPTNCDISSRSDTSRLPRRPRQDPRVRAGAPRIDARRAAHAQASEPEFRLPDATPRFEQAKRRVPVPGGDARLQCAPGALQRRPQKTQRSSRGISSQCSPFGSGNFPYARRRIPPA